MRLKDEFISVEHFLLAATEERIFKGIRHHARAVDAGVARSARQQWVTSQNAEATYEALERYGRDPTKLAGQGKLDPAIRRDDVPMTSNIGSHRILEYRGTFEGVSTTACKETVLDEMRHAFRPKFLNRVDEISCSTRSRRSI